MQRILDINRQRKVLPTIPHFRDQEKALQEELRLLNKLAEQQALLIRRYESIGDKDH